MYKRFTMKSISVQGRRPVKNYSYTVLSKPEKLITLQNVINDFF